MKFIKETLYYLLVYSSGIALIAGIVYAIILLWNILMDIAP